MRTVHFAHWAFVNNGSRLLFFSNFDHSWDSYLDDFIEKAHVGLTLAWGCGVGFPPTRFLIHDGASHGRRFKNWALASRRSAASGTAPIATLTVDQIERNNRIANGLRKPSLSPEEAATWIGTCDRSRPSNGRAGSWRRRSTSDTQGLVVSGFGQPADGPRAVPGDSAGRRQPGPRGAWLKALKEVAPVTSAVRPDSPNVQPRATALAFTWTGLKRMGLPADGARLVRRDPFAKA